MNSGYKEQIFMDPKNSPSADVTVAASVLVMKDTTPPYRMSGTLFSNVNNIQSMITED